VREAARIYVEQVIRPASETPAGVARVGRLCELWLDYSQGRVFPGGCFFYEVVAEFDARPGPVHDAVAQAQRDWTAHVEHTITEARDLGELRPDTDTAQLAFECVALMETANAISVLRDETDAYRRARVAITSRLRAAASDPSLVPELS
jgi:hypothetical protein